MLHAEDDRSERSIAASEGDRSEGSIAAQRRFWCRAGRAKTSLSGSLGPRLDLPHARPGRRVFQEENSVLLFSNPGGRGRDRSPFQEFRKVARGRAGAMGVEAPSPEKGLMGATMEVPVSTAEL